MVNKARGVEMLRNKTIWAGAGLALFGASGIAVWQFFFVDLPEPPPPAPIAIAAASNLPGAEAPISAAAAEVQQAADINGSSVGAHPTSPLEVGGATPSQSPATLIGYAEESPPPDSYLGKAVLYFNSGAWQKPESWTELEKLPLLGSIIIHGHADRVMDAPFNQALSQKRAEGVAHFIAGKGIPRDRLLVRGFGEDKPVDRTEDEVPSKLNRRVEIFVYH